MPFIDFLLVEEFSENTLYKKTNDLNPCYKRNYMSTETYWVFSLIINFMCSFQPFLEKRLKLQDTCGIHNLHAIPGMFGGFIGAIVAASASVEVYSAEG